MRFSVQLLNIGATVNSFVKKSFIEIAQGETVNVMFQLIDKDQGLRYMPATGATVYVELARFPEYFPTNTNQRTTSDFSIRRFATQPFAADSSIWMLPLVAADTINMMSTNMRFTLTEGTKVSIFLLPQAIKVNKQETLSDIATD